MIKAHISFQYLFNSTSPAREKRHNNKSRKIRDYDEMTDELWEDYANDIEKELDKPETQNITRGSNINAINRTWDLLKNSMNRAADRHFPTKNVSNKPLRIPEILRNIFRPIRSLNHLIHKTNPNRTFHHTSLPKDNWK